jgi:ferritin-like protein
VSVEALSAALQAEHAAVYGYGVVGAHLDAAGKTTAADAENVHRNRRDALILRITQEKGNPPAAAAAYALPYPVTDRASALKLAVALEAGAAVAWRQALGGTTGDDRTMALNALIDCAMRATQWRVTGGITPATVPFPGTPA